MTDGNLTSDSLWTNVWNGENRRSTIESRTTLPAGAKVKEQWTHLADGRWIERIVSTNNGTSYYPSLTNRYVWDGQILLAVLDHTNGLVLSFMRGLDLSGSIQGAGGVGGVLAVKAGTSAQCGAMANTTHFTCYDGNGNVTALVDTATGSESGRYEYGPFAEGIRLNGAMAKLNPVRSYDNYRGAENAPAAPPQLPVALNTRGRVRVTQEQRQVILAELARSGASLPKKPAPGIRSRARVNDHISPARYRS